MPRKAVEENNRLSLRIAPGEKTLLMRAAALENTDLTAFVLRHTVPAARHVIQHAEKVALSPRDSERVLELLDNPPQPNERLRAAARRLPPHR